MKRDPIIHRSKPTGKRRLPTKSEPEAEPDYLRKERTCQLLDLNAIDVAETPPVRRLSVRQPTEVRLVTRDIAKENVHYRVREIDGDERRPMGCPCASDTSTAITSLREVIDRRWSASLSVPYRYKTGVSCTS